MKMTLSFGTPWALRRSTMVVVVDEQGQPLVVHRPGQKALFCFPGGKLEPGEQLAQGAGREFTEETGLRAGQLHWICAGVCDIGDGSPAYWTDAFVVVAPEGCLGMCHEDLCPHFGSWHDVLVRSPFVAFNHHVVRCLFGLISHDTTIGTLASWQKAHDHIKPFLSL